MNNLSNIASYTVTQLNNSIKNLINSSFQDIKVVGEISQLKIHSSGHIYFSLKDDESIISAICWRSVVPRISLEIEEGISVIVKGRVTTYHQHSKYQIIVDEIQYEGEGSLLKLLEVRKNKLKKLGFFDLDKKKKIPKFPQSIGVITSKSGVVFDDIIHRISDRFPTELQIYSANVQGNKCLNDILDGITYFNNKKSEDSVDLIIIARGGGSLEDLMPFNEEMLIKKIFNSQIPIVSAVGHETDFTLCDLVADLRAPTPSAAAEMVVPDRDEIILRLNEWENSLKKSIIHNFKVSDLNFQILKSKLPDLFENINNNLQTLDNINQILETSLTTKLKNTKISLYKALDNFSPDKLEGLINIYLTRLFNNFEKINYFIKKNILQLKENIKFRNRELLILSYRKTLNRGFAVVRKNDEIITTDLQIKKNEKFLIEFSKDITAAKKI